MLRVFKLLAAHKTCFDSQATRVIDVLGLFFDMLSIGVCTTRHWPTSGRLVQELSACTVHGNTVFNGAF